MNRTATAHAHADAAITTAEAVEDWMVDAYNDADVALTAHAIRGAAAEVQLDLRNSIAVYADGYTMPRLAELHSMLSAMRSVLAWADDVAA